MENQTHFDLNAAVENWRNELAAQPNLASDDRRELETHLRDAIAGFQQRGLNDEESFWLARRRVGQPLQLCEEFVKADPAKIWRERVFWMVLALLVFSLWTNLVGCIPLHHWLDNGHRGLLSAYLYEFLIYSPVMGLATLMAKGQLNSHYSALTKFFQSRWRFAISAIVFIVATHGSQAVMQYKYLIQMDHGRQTHTFDGYWMNVFFYISWPLILVLLTTWLLPPQNRKTPKRA
jgi:hypothetical protein